MPLVANPMPEECVANPPKVGAARSICLDNVPRIVSVAASVPTEEETPSLISGLTRVAGPSLLPESDPRHRAAAESC